MKSFVVVLHPEESEVIVEQLIGKGELCVNGPKLLTGVIGRIDGWSQVQTLASKPLTE